MAVSQTFKNVVSSGDILRIRLLMSNELLIDPTFQNFTDMEMMVKGMDGLYVPFDGDALDTDENHWDDHYLALQQTMLVSNFCPERIKYVKKIISKLHPSKTMTATPESCSGKKTKSDWDFRGDSRSQRPIDYQTQKRAAEASGRIVKVMVGCGVGGAAIGAGLIGLKIVESSIPAGIIVGGAIGCAIGYLLGEE